jgi:hypothetical protein
MPEFSPAMPDPDEFDQHLRDLTSGRAEPAKFTEPSAAERLRRVPSPPPPPPRRTNWRNARKARQLRKPIPEPGRKLPDQIKRRSRPRRTASGPRRRFIAIAKVVGIVIAFAALLYGLHLLGFGPQ